MTTHTITRDVEVTTCVNCTDDHVLTADAVVMPRAEAVLGYDYWWSSDEAFDDAKWRGRE
jgi:hypothetical protein